MNAYFRALEDALVAAEESSFDIDLNNREQLSNLVRAVRPSTHGYSRGTHGVLMGYSRGTSRPQSAHNCSGTVLPGLLAGSPGMGAAGASACTHACVRALLRLPASMALARVG